MPVTIKLSQIYAMKDIFNLKGIRIYPDLEGDPIQDAMFVFRLLTGNPFRDFLIEFELQTTGIYVPIRRADLILKPIWRYFEGLDLYPIFDTSQGKEYVREVISDDRTDIKTTCSLLINPYPTLSDALKNFVDNFEVPAVYYYWGDLPGDDTDVELPGLSSPK